MLVVGEMHVENGEAPVAVKGWGVTSGEVLLDVADCCGLFEEAFPVFF